jgi:hypothetical protein
MGARVKRVLVILAAGLPLAATGWAEEVRRAADWQDMPEPPSIEELEEGFDDPAYETGDVESCFEGCSRGSCTPCCPLIDMYGFFAGEAWANQADDNGHNNFGFRTGLNSGIPLLRCPGIGLQLGASIGLYDLHGRDQGAVSTVEDQTMVTAGIFKRSNVCCGDPLSWAFVYDYQFHDNFGEDGLDYIGLGQFRSQVGLALDACREVGVWITQTNGDTDVIRETAPPGQPGTVTTFVEPVNQYNVFWKQHWDCGGDTMIYAGPVEDPGEWVVGLNGRVPLDCRWSLFYGFHYISPSANAGHAGFKEEIWNVTGGLVFYPGGNARASTVSGNRWQPLLPVADNGSFALDQDP